jgi:hypothetical protein
MVSLIVTRSPSKELSPHLVRALSAQLAAYLALSSSNMTIAFNAGLICFMRCMWRSKSSTEVAGENCLREG